MASHAADGAAGKKIYDRNCASCHGPTGQGPGGRSPVPNFTDAAAMAKKTDTDLLAKITNGGQGTGMPAYGKVLSEKDREDVLAYIRSLSSPR